MAKLKEGARAPAFTLTDQRGKKVKLSDHKGKRVVVYFYPRADTPGCTTQSCSLRDTRPEEAQGSGPRHQPRLAGEAEEVRREVRPRLPAARRRGPQGRESVGHVGSEEPLRTQVHGHHPLRVRHRRARQDRRGLLQDLAQGHRPQGHPGAARLTTPHTSATGTTVSGIRHASATAEPLHATPTAWRGS